MRDPGTIENGVLFGQDGELFLAHGGHFVLDIATGRKQIDPAMFGIFESNILGRAALCESYGARYLHVIFPDKQSVLRERFPFPDPVCLGLLYQQHCTQAAEHILNLTETLREQSKRVFKKTDTHLNDNGLILACAAIQQWLGNCNHFDSLVNLPEKAIATLGDLASKLATNVAETSIYLQPNWPVHFYSNSISFGNDGLIDIYVAPKSILSTRLLWFGDSFGRGCVKFLSMFFREIVFLRTRFIHAEMVAQIRPDLVITQNAERYLDVISPDESATPFLLYPMLKQITYTPPLSFATALSALMSFPRSPYNDFLRSVGL